MSSPLRVLVLGNCLKNSENCQKNTSSFLEKLINNGYELVTQNIDDGSKNTKAMLKQNWDIIITDYEMPTTDKIAQPNIKENGNNISLLSLIECLIEKSL
jgi:hypothetical protein